ncbi:threonine dehydratase [Paracoccus methylarcula]|uniref:Threonine dehydratase n=1 Tax=Paracoccus methylarcula TaxID=72022 RepID=A0A3R7PPQ5_9RHOB|nr:threonine dehydratase [Paracoccus methylarcula]RNF34527.1 threonine dehydratase [Paracoccus methylarcula]
MRFTAEDLQEAARLVYTQMQPTPQYAWPQLAQRLGCEVWVKHENHGPTGAFKARGGITFIDWMRRAHPELNGICTATRGNHGQSQARAASAAGLTAKIFVPFGNSVEKNRAMRAFGAELIEFGEDFDEARVEAFRVAEEEGLLIVPPFHRELVRGVATYAYELLTVVPDLDTVYVPIGCGSGICGTILARDALGLPVEVVGVVSAEAQCAKLSVEAGRPVETHSPRTIADGMAVRVPVPEAMAIYGPGTARFVTVTVTDAELAEAMRVYYSDIHNIAEAAGAASLAALMQDQERMRGRKAGVILSGGNIDKGWYLDVLQGSLPQI